MKNAFAIFLVMTMFFTSACAGPSTPAGTPKPTIIDLSAQATHSDRDTEVTIDMVSVPFEQVIETATNVVKAECVQTIYDGRSYEHTFEIQKQYKGEILEKQIQITCTPGGEICIMDKGYSYGVYNQFYPGNTYVLVLSCRRSVYFEQDLFAVKSNICIPVENISAASMHNRPLCEYSNLNPTQAKSFKQVEQYIIRLCTACITEGNYDGQDYIRSNQLSEILVQSPYVLRIEPISLKSSQMDGGAQRYKCKVITAYKGSVPEGIYVTFFPDTVMVGEQYIVAITKESFGEDRFRFSAKGSLISVDQEQEVLNILQL